MVRRRSDDDFEGVFGFKGVGEGGEELGDLDEVLEADEFDGGVHVAGGEAEQGAGDAAAGPEDDIGIGATGGGDGFVLELDAFFVGDFFESGDDLDVIGAAVGDGWAGADADIAVEGFADRGDVRGVGDVRDEGDVGFEFVGDLAGTEAASFFHDIGDGANFGFEVFAVVGEEAESFGDGPGADAVIEGAADGEVVAEEFELGVQGDGVADLDEFLGFFPGGDADIEEEVLDFGEAAVFGGFGEVRCDVADDPVYGAFAGMDDDALGFGDGWVYPAHPADVDESVVGNVVHGEGDFVGVGGEHDAGGSAFIEDGDTVAIGVGEGFIGVFFGVIEPDALAAGFVAGGAGGIDLCAEEFEGGFSLGGEGWLERVGAPAGSAFASRARDARESGESRGKRVVGGSPAQSAEGDFCVLPAPDSQLQLSIAIAIPIAIAMAWASHALRAGMGGMDEAICWAKRCGAGWAFWSCGAPPVGPSGRPLPSGFRLPGFGCVSTAGVGFGSTCACSARTYAGWSGGW